MDVSAILGTDAGVQYMFPYMDYRLLDFAISIPRRLYHDGITNRLIYRKAFRYLMPQSLYEVNYKHFASQIEDKDERASNQKDKSFSSVDQTIQMEVIRNWLQNRRDSILQMLDEDVWKNHLDFDKIRQIGEQAYISQKEYDDQTDVLNELVYCAYLHNAGVRIKDYTRNL